MNLISELIGLEEAKKPKCTCEKDEETCKVHGLKEEHEDQDHVDNGGAPLSHAAAKDEYEGSVDFTNDMTDVDAAIRKIEGTIHTAKWEAWMKITDQNFGTDCAEAQNKVEVAYREFQTAWDDLMDEIDKAQ